MLSPWRRPVELRGQVAIVIGGSRGIGRATVESLARRGCPVVVAARGADAVRQTVAEVSGTVGFPECDVRDVHAVEALFQFALDRFQTVDILVNSAGIGLSERSASRTPQAVVSLDDHGFDDVLETNLRGLFLAVRAASRIMVARRHGQIIDISSARGARRGQGYGAAYCASKMATREMVESLADELAPRGIRVMSLLPDAVDTSLIAGTTLAPRGAMQPKVVGEFVAEMLSLPMDSTFDKPLLAPLGARTGHRKQPTSRRDRS